MVNKVLEQISVRSFLRDHSAVSVPVHATVEGKASQRRLRKRRCRKIQDLQEATQWKTSTDGLARIGWQIDAPQHAFSLHTAMKATVNRNFTDDKVHLRKSFPEQDT